MLNQKERCAETVRHLVKNTNVAVRNHILAKKKKKGSVITK